MTKKNNMARKITIGLIFRNEEKKIKNCLKSLLKHANFGGHLILVDNASIDQTVPLVKNILLEWLGTYEIIQRHENNLGAARQDVVDRVQTEYLYFTDADCVIQSFTIPALLARMQEGKWAAVGGVQDFLAENVFQKHLNKIKNHFIFHLGSAQLWKPAKACSVEHVSTSNVLYKVSALQAIHGFNPKLSRSAEDLDLSLRLVRRGYKLCLEPKSHVLHDQVEHWKEWMFVTLRNGRWQTELIFHNREQLLTKRPWLFFLGLFCLSTQPELLITGYFSWLVVFGPRSWILPLSHGCYALGGLWGLITGPINNLKRIGF